MLKLNQGKSAKQVTRGVTTIIAIGAIAFYNFKPKMAIAPAFSTAIPLTATDSTARFTAPEPTYELREGKVYVDGKLYSTESED